MRIAIIHYHLRGGGVTRVVHHILSALREGGHRAVVVTGEAPVDPEFPTNNVVVIPALGYHVAGRQTNMTGLVTDLTQIVEQHLGGPPHVWHIHNHALGKNIELPLLTQRLAGAGVPILLQMHDFVEDGRPDNYRFLNDRLGGEKELSTHLYPSGRRVHYATLNQRDHGFLVRAGLDPGRCHLLPNAVHLVANERIPENDDTGAKRGRLFLYPTRAIRRKNLGEFILWAALARRGDRFAVTLAPQNPKAKPVYNKWIDVARSRNLPVEFAVGKTSGLSFPALLKQAHAVVTTSVAEGFGLAFLEPWLVQRPLLGRNLAEITREFTAKGVDLDALYDQLLIPLEWVGKEKLCENIRNAYQDVRESYGRASTPNLLQWAADAAIQDDSVDYGRLDEKTQEKVLDILVYSRTARKELSPRQLAVKAASREVCAQNWKNVLRAYSLDEYKAKLLRTYVDVAGDSAAPPDCLDGQELLTQFLAPRRFYLLRAH